MSAFRPARRPGPDGMRGTVRLRSFWMKVLSVLLPPRGVKTPRTWLFGRGETLVGTSIMVSGSLRQDVTHSEELLISGGGEY